jgi:hypothetical protein
MTRRRQTRRVAAESQRLAIQSHTSVSAIPDSTASTPYRRRAGTSDVLRDPPGQTHDPGLDVRLGRAGSASTAIATVALRSLVLIVIATLLVLVGLPTALTAAGT